MKRWSPVRGTADGPAQTRRFFDRVLALPWVEGPDGEHVFTRCPGDAGVHPAPTREGASGRVPALCLSCDVLGDTVAELVCGGATIIAADSTCTVGHAPVITMRVPRYHGTVALRPHRDPRAGRTRRSPA